MDRITSISYGRPFSISQHTAYAVPWPAVDQNSPVPSTVTPSEVSHSIESADYTFFVESVKLLSLLDDSVVSPNVVSQDTTIFQYLSGQSDTLQGTGLLRIDYEIENWYNQLAMPLAPCPPPGSTGSLARLAVMLHQRYLLEICL